MVSTRLVIRPVASSVSRIAPASDAVGAPDHAPLAVAGDRVAALEHPAGVERAHDRLVRVEPERLPPSWYPAPVASSRRRCVEHTACARGSRAARARRPVRHSRRGGGRRRRCGGGPARRARPCARSSRACSRATAAGALRRARRPTSSSSRAATAMRCRAACGHPLRRVVEPGRRTPPTRPHQQLRARGRGLAGVVRDLVGHAAVGLVPDARDDRHRHRRDRAGDQLGVERREVGARPAAAGEHHGVEVELRQLPSAHLMRRAAAAPCTATSTTATRQRVADSPRARARSRGTPRCPSS